MSPGVAAEGGETGIGHIGRIPVRNIWLLMLYASRLYRVLPMHRRSTVEEEPDQLPDLVAEILTHAVERRLRRNLSFGFRQREADLNRVRGRIDLLRTERRQLLRRGRVACRFEELTVDTPMNRYVRAALVRLVKVVGDPQLAHGCRRAVSMLERAGVGGEPSIPDLHQSGEALIRQLGHMDVQDRQMMAAAHLAFNLALPTEETGTKYLPVPDREERWARRLFEKAVGGFYDVALPRTIWTVRPGGAILHWPYEEATDGIRSMLPAMRTDIMLEGPVGRIIIDTKFTAIMTGGWYGGQRLSSSYIYQMYAYLRSQEQDDDPLSRDATGISLHPAIEDDVDEAARIQGHEIRFATVNLAADCRAIRRRLLDLVETSALKPR